MLQVIGFKNIIVDEHLPQVLSPLYKMKRAESEECGKLHSMVRRVADVTLPLGQFDQTDEQHVNKAKEEALLKWRPARRGPSLRHL